MANSPPAFALSHNNLEIEIENKPPSPNYRHSPSTIEASSSSSNRSSYCPFDVFINHRGPDVKKTLASHLYRRLISYGLRVFLDYQELQEGENLSCQIQGAITTASVHVAIFSPRYAESSWCLNELLQMLQSGAPIIPVFYHVRPDHLRWTMGNDGVYAQALHELEMKKTYDSETKEQKLRYDSTAIKRWRNALSSVAEISGLDLAAFNGDEGELLDKVVELVLKRGKRTQLNVADYPTGLDQKVKDFEKTVLSQQHSGKVQVVGIAGLGGVGKTTLAKELFNRKSSNYSKAHFLSEIRENAAKSSLDSLQSKLLKDSMQLDLHINNSHHGIEMISKHFASSQVLLVLDDVDHVDQVNALLPLKTKDALHPNSLILITSRDKNVLARSGVQDSSIYMLTGLDPQHSKELLCSHAFCQPHPLPGFEYLVDEFVRACNQLPLSLKVFGGLLNGNIDKSYWQVQLDRLQQTLPGEIQKRLQISYDALHREEQEIFLDIVCFFIGENLDTAISIWEGSRWKGLAGFQTLQNKSLVEVDSSNMIKMHGHLRDMGREIVKASGLQRCLGGPTEDIDEVLQKSDVITEVRGIRTVVSGHNDHLEYKCFMSEMSWYKRRSHELFGKRLMKLRKRVHNRKLQLLDIENGHLQRILRRVHSPNLIWLSWRECPYYSPPSWIPMDNLRVLQVFGSVLKTLWQSKSQVPLQLRELVINSPLSKLPKTIGQLKHLQLLVIGRSNLKTLPEEFCYMRSLKQLKLTNCSELKVLPDSFGYLTNLEHIDLSGSVSLEGLPNSFGDLRELKYLDLEFCYNLSISDETLGNIRKLEYIDLSCCWKIKVLPPQLAHQPSLEKLYWPFLEMVPSPLSRNLKQLILHNCIKEFKCLPISVGMLTKLTVKNCPLRELPLENVEEEEDTLGELRGQRRVCNLDSSIDKCMLRLQHLRLYNTKISKVSFSKDVFHMVFHNLQHLQISACNDLIVVGTLPKALIKLELTCFDNLRKIEGLCNLSKLQMLDISWWEEVEDLPNIEKLLSLEELWAYGCVKLKSIKGLAQLTKLRVLDIRWCYKLEELLSVEYCVSLEYFGYIGCPKLEWGEGVLEQLRLRVKDLETERSGRILYMKIQEEEDEEARSSMKDLEEERRGRIQKKPFLQGRTWKRKEEEGFSL